MKYHVFGERELKSPSRDPVSCFWRLSHGIELDFPLENKKKKEKKKKEVFFNIAVELVDEVS